MICTRAGDWSISVLYDNQNIEGSPFHVRVQDPNKVRVYGLQTTSNVRQESKFSGDVQTVLVILRPDVLAICVCACVHACVA